MSNTRNHIPLLSAIAGGTVLRAGGFPSWGRSDMASPTVLLPIYRGHTR